MSISPCVTEKTAANHLAQTRRTTKCGSSLALRSCLGAIVVPNHVATSGRHTAVNEPTSIKLPCVPT